MKCSSRRNRPNAQSTPDVAALDDFFYASSGAKGLRAYGRVVFNGRTLGPITDLGDAYQPPSVATDVDGFVVALQQQRRHQPHSRLTDRERDARGADETRRTSRRRPARPIACDGANCATVWLESIAPNGCTPHSCNIAAEVRAKEAAPQSDRCRVRRRRHESSGHRGQAERRLRCRVEHSTTTSFALIEGDRVIRSERRVARHAAGHRMRTDRPTSWRAMSTAT